MYVADGKISRPLERVDGPAKGIGSVERMLRAQRMYRQKKVVLR